MELLETYKALADESRLRIVSILSRGAFSVGELTDLLGLSQPTVSHHLKILQRAGVTTSRKDGTWVFYTLHESTETKPQRLVIESYLEVSKNLNGDPLASALAEDESGVRRLLNQRRDKAREFFESVASDWTDIRSEAVGTEATTEDLARVIPDDGSFLELGCGSGALLQALLPRNGETIGVDYSQAMLDAAKKNLGARATQVDLRLGNLEHLPLGDDRVDHAAAYMVIHHVPEPREAIKDIYRVLKRGGSLRILDLVQHDREYMRERFADLWLGFEPDAFRGWVEAAGFCNTEILFLGEKKEAFLLTTHKT